MFYLCGESVNSINQFEIPSLGYAENYLSNLFVSIGV
jgi:hypothetical protein